MGKLQTPDLKKLLGCIKKDDRVLVPPMIGYDAGVHRLGNEYVVVATDPCTGVPREWFGWLLINYAASDVALSGAQPQFCTITLLGPRSTKSEAFDTIMKQTCAAADELGIAIVRGHTGVYDSVSELVGVCTVYGSVEADKLLTVGGAKTGDSLFCTKPLGLETVTNFSIAFPTLSQRLFGVKKQKELSKLVPMQSCVKEALKLARVQGVNAMHDATEGGFVAAINELSEASKIGVQVKWDKLPIPKEAMTLKESFKLTDEQVLAMSSTGTILMAVAPENRESAIETLTSMGLKGVCIGEFTAVKERILVKDGEKKPFPKMASDPYTMILAAKS